MSFLGQNGVEMKILAVSDQVVERIYTLASSGYFNDIDMILGCGDLPYTYLEYLVTILNVPMFYVPGNHDPEFVWGHAATRAEGGINIDREVICAKDLILAGLGGSIRYRPDGVNQYTQNEMYWRMFRLIPRLIRNRWKYGRALDVLVTHSPPYGIHDENSQAHQGFRALNWLINWAKPRYHLHGHTHFFRRNLKPSSTSIGSTQVINVFPYRLIEDKNE